MAYTNYSAIDLPDEGFRSATFLEPLFRIGTAASPAKISTTVIPLTDIQATTALAAGTIQVANIALVNTAIQTGAVSIEAFKVTITSNVKIGGANCAIYGKVDLQTSGAAHGMASAVCAEMIVPDSSLSRGALYALELELGGGASSSWASAGPVAFIYCGGWGAGLITGMNTRGYLIDIQGFAEGSNLLVDNDGANPTATGGIRCRVGATDIWLLYRDSAPA